jgi:DNA mismatch repair protein MutL
MPQIRQLPTTLVNKIAAGEVIERPASVVKELLENSVDAGASRIEVLIEEGGNELIRISDNGCGIAVDELLLAVSSHATSKLPDDDALYSVATLGFRGEALASIAGVSHLLLRSRTAEQDSGAEISARGGAIEGPEPCAAPVGTTIEVRNLFFNTPVRRKFLRSAATEMGHITEAFTRIALAFPEVQFRLQSGERELFHLASTNRWEERIQAFFGSEVGDALIPIEGDDEEVKLSGFVCKPTANRANNRMQYLFLNGRFIRDRALQHALGEAYRGLLMVGRFPICFLQLELPSDQVDVNVHPTKLEVRFADGSRVYGKLLQTLRHTFLATDLTARVPSSASPLGTVSPISGTPVVGRVGSDFARPQGPQQSAFQFQPIPGAARLDTMGLSRGVPVFRPYPDAASNKPLDIPPWERLDAAPSSVSQAASESRHIGDPHETTLASNRESHELVAAEVAPVIAGTLGMQVHNRYLITQDEQGMLVIDQHALHERILYERIREKVLGGHLESQRLLVPEPVTLSPAEAAAAMDARELLARVGIEIEGFGGDAVVVRSYPAMLANMSPGEMLRQALESLLAAGKDPEIRDLLDHLLHSIACKAAIKAGDRLTAEEVSALLEQRHHYQDTHHCPHGRPTSLHFSRDELDRMFGRLGPRKIPKL